MKKDESRIFLSSTWQDLEIYRRAVIFTLTRLEKRIKAMEYFGSGSKSTLVESIEKVKECGVYIGIVGTRYGTIATDGKSITELEYEAALENNSDILIYIIDEDKQAVLPKFVDTGKSAKKLKRFKKRLRKTHLCSPFTTPQDLSVKIALDVIENYRSKIDKEELTSELNKEIPNLIVETGFTYGLEKNNLELVNLIEIDNSGKIKFVDSEFQDIISATYIAMELSKGRFDCLKHIIVFDKFQWDLIIHLLRKFPVDPKLLSERILTNHDPFQYRLLVNIAGNLEVEQTCEAICKSFLGTNMDNKLLVFDLPMRSIRDVVKETLSQFSQKSLPVLERYEKIAKEGKKWRQKSTFSQVIKRIKNK